MLVINSSPNVGVILGALATGWSHTGDTAETKLASIAIPANALPVGGMIEVFHHWSHPNNSNTKTLRLRFGAANDLTGTQMYNDARTTSTGMLTRTYIALRAAGSQIGYAINVSGGFGSTASTSPAPAAIDTTAITYIVLSGQCSNAGDTVTLESYLVRLNPAV